MTIVNVPIIQLPYNDAPANSGPMSSIFFWDAGGGVTQDFSPMNTYATGVAFNYKDMGSPEVREVVYNLAERSGVDDQTRYSSQRLIDLRGVCFPRQGFPPGAAGGAPASPPGAGVPGYGNYQSRSISWERLAPFLNPDIRFTITYNFDTDVSARIASNCRLSSFTRTASSPVTFDFQLQFKADPIVLSSTVNSVDIGTGTVVSGRKYPRSYHLAYTTAGGLTDVLSQGKSKTWPIYRIYGPCTDPAIAIVDTKGTLLYGLSFSIQLTASQMLEVLTQPRTIMLGGPSGSNAYNALIPGSTWGMLAPGDNYIQYTVQASSGGSHCVVLWQDAYLY
jgi:hypothetical protein